MKLAHVSSEGGPLLIVDAQHLGAWQGVGRDYDRACSTVASLNAPDGGLISVGEGEGLVWNIGGAGTAFIINPRKGFPFLFRYWSDADLGENEIESIAAEINWSTVHEVSVLKISSGRLAVVWAVENGPGLKLPPSEGYILGDTSTEDSGYVLTVPTGCFAALLVKGTIRGVDFRGLAFRATR